MNWSEFFSLYSVTPWMKSTFLQVLFNIPIMLHIHILLPLKWIIYQEYKTTADNVRVSRRCWRCDRSATRLTPICLDVLYQLLIIITGHPHEADKWCRTLLGLRIWDLPYRGVQSPWPCLIPHVCIIFNIYLAKAHLINILACPIPTSIYPSASSVLHHSFITNTNYQPGFKWCLFRRFLSRKTGSAKMVTWVTIEVDLKRTGWKLESSCHPFPHVPPISNGMGTHSSTSSHFSIVCADDDYRHPIYRRTCSCYSENRLVCYQLFRRIFLIRFQVLLEL